MSCRRPARLFGFQYRGLYRYFTTCCAESRRRAFTDDETVVPLTQQILHTWHERHFAVFAYVIMPDHVHLLVEGTGPDADFRSAMRVFRQRAAMTFRRQTGLRLWQDGYYERVLRRDEAVLPVAAYILQNPVRAGLVTRVGDYPYAWAAPVLGLTSSRS